MHPWQWYLLNCRLAFSGVFTITHKIPRARRFTDLQRSALLGLVLGTELVSEQNAATFASVEDGWV